MPIDPEDLTRRMQAGTPFMKLLDIRVLSADGVTAELELPLREELTQFTGYAHGGVVATLADLACTVCHKTPTVTVDLRIDYVRGAVGQKLSAVGTTIREGKRIVTTRADVFAHRDGERRLCAIAQATLTPTG